MPLATAPLPANVEAVPNPKLLLAVPALGKSDKLLAFTNFSPNEVEIVVAKLASSPKAAANSFNVFKVLGAESTNPDTSASTYALIDCWLAAAVALFDAKLSSSSNVN